MALEARLHSLELARRVFSQGPSSVVLSVSPLPPPTMTYSLRGMLLPGVSFMVCYTIPLFSLGELMFSSPCALREFLGEDFLVEERSV